MPKKYYVERRLTNGKTGGIAYDKPTQFDNIDAATKEFHNVLATYVNYGDLIKVAVLLYDEDNAIIESKVWRKNVPAPEPEESKAE